MFTAKPWEYLLLLFQCFCNPCEHGINWACVLALRYFGTRIERLCSRKEFILHLKKSFKKLKHAIITNESHVVVLQQVENLYIKYYNDSMKLTNKNLSLWSVRLTASNPNSTQSYFPYSTYSACRGRSLRRRLHLPWRIVFGAQVRHIYSKT